MADLDLRDKITNVIAPAKGINGALPVTLGGYGESHNRYLTGITATHPGTDVGYTATWTTAEGVTDLRILALGVATEALQADDGFRVVVNAPDAATAASWLGTTSPLLDQDVVFEMGFVGQDLYISRTEPITRIDFEATTGTLAAIFIGAV